MLTERVKRLRWQSLEAVNRLSHERAELLTDFMATGVSNTGVSNTGVSNTGVSNTGVSNTGVSNTCLRALAFRHILLNKKIWIGEGELIVGERGPEPKAVPTYPEICLHSMEDLEALYHRPKVSFESDSETRRIYREKIIPFWQGKTQRDRIFGAMEPEWIAAYEAGIFTEFQEQRSPGHTVLGDKIYKRGFLDLIREIDEHMMRIEGRTDEDALARTEELKAMRISAEALIHYAERHAERLEEMAGSEQPDGDGPGRREELLRMAEICHWVPAHAPRTFHEALQYYWFVHLGVITELNPWDSFNPGRLDQHLYPFYRKELDEGTLSREEAAELLCCFWVKFNNHPAPPKIGITAQESSTYTDFALINVGGLKSDGSDAVNELSYLLLEVVEEMRILQPSSMVQLSRVSPDGFIQRALQIVKTGFGQPSIFNGDAIVQELVRQGKSLTDAREGGASGCVESGAFGREAYWLTGYFNLPKVLEVTLHGGVDPRTGKKIGLETPMLETPVLETLDLETLLQHFNRQLRHFIDIKIKGNMAIEKLFADHLPAPFLSLLIDDCIATGKDYHDGGARYNTSYIQGVGLGSVTDMLAAMKYWLFADRILGTEDGKTVGRDEKEMGRRGEEETGRRGEEEKGRRGEEETGRRGEEETGRISMEELKRALAVDFVGYEDLRYRLVYETPKYGNDDDYADELAVRVFEMFFDAVDGRPNARGGQHHIMMLPTTSHVYFGSVTGATPDGRKAWQPLSEGISPFQGADTKGPTAVLKSASRIDHLRTGGTLLNQKFTPQLLKDKTGTDALANLIRGYFRMNGHHIQFNVVTAGTLKEAQLHPERYRDLIVRVAGYSDYFNDLGEELQNEIIRRTEQDEF